MWLYGICELGEQGAWGEPMWIRPYEELYGSYEEAKRQLYICAKTIAKDVCGSVLVFDEDDDNNWIVLRITNEDNPIYMDLGIHEYYYEI